MPRAAGRDLRSAADDARTPPLDIVSAGPRARPWVRPAAAVLVGVAIGAGGMHYLDARPRPSPDRVDVRVSLGAQAGTMNLVGGDPVVTIPLVLTDAGSPVTLTSLEVSRPGASLVPDPTGQPSQPLPAVLVPGAAVDLRIGLRSDCTVPVRPPPLLVLVVTDEGGLAHSLSVTVPDLDSIWGQTLVPGACPNTG